MKKRTAAAYHLARRAAAAAALAIKDIKDKVDHREASDRLAGAHHKAPGAPGKHPALTELARRWIGLR